MSKQPVHLGSAPPLQSSEVTPSLSMPASTPAGSDDDSQVATTVSTDVPVASTPIQPTIIRVPATSLEATDLKESVGELLASTPATASGRVGIDSHVLDEARTFVAQVSSLQAEPSDTSAKSLTMLEDAKPSKVVPHDPRSWQFWLYWLSFRFINKGPSLKEQLKLREIQLIGEIQNIPLVDWFVVTVLSIIGGIGKTMITAYLLRLFGLHRVDDRGVGIDNNPDMGLLAKRLGIAEGTWKSLKEVYEGRDQLRTFSRLRRFIPFIEGVAVIGAVVSDSGFYDAFDQLKYNDLLKRLMPLTSGVFNDAGTGVLSTPISKAAIANTLVPCFVADASDDAFSSAVAAYLELCKQGHALTAVNGVLVLNRIKTDDDVARYYEQFGAQGETPVRAIVVVPWDAWLANRDNSVDLERISTATRVALLSALKAVLEGVAVVPSSRVSEPAPSAS